MWLEYLPVKDVRQLRLEFPLPDLTEYYDCDVSQDSELNYQIEGSLINTHTSHGLQVMDITGN